LKERALELSTAKQQLEISNRILEEKIKERTKELEKANQGLEKQVAEKNQRTAKKS